jgi:16S rRNA (adenine1518-N6/adenine1519-N6)-dimethyltransferase
VSPYRAKKRLGQHFLKSDAIVARIVELADLRPSETVLEIGPGRGRLTLPLAETGARVVAVEFDRDLLGYLTKLISGYPNVEILHTDFLTMEPSAHGLNQFTLVGNIPYNITSPVMAWCVRHQQRMRKGLLMVQKEMALRIAGKPGSKGWSPLAINTQVRFDVAVSLEVAARHFNPPPAVTSAVIELTPHTRPLGVPYEKLDRVTRAAFQQRRKMLVNNLAPELLSDPEAGREVLERLGLPTNVRAEQMTIEQFVRLTLALDEIEQKKPR